MASSLVEVKVWESNQNVQNVGPPRPSKGSKKRKEKSPTPLGEIPHLEESGAGTRRTSKRAAAVVAAQNLKKRSVRLPEKPDGIVTMSSPKPERKFSIEVQAVLETSDGPEDGRPARSLMDFIIHDEDGQSQYLEMITLSELYISAWIFPLDRTEDKEEGAYCEAFGRIECWSISGFEQGVPIIWIETKFADYTLVKPAQTYKPFYSFLLDKAFLCMEVFKKLHKPLQGDPNTGIEELIAGVLRAMSTNKNFVGTCPTKEFIICLGGFIFQQLTNLDDEPEFIGYNGCRFSEMPALLALKEEHNRTSGVVQLNSGGSLTIRERSPSDSNDIEVFENEKAATLFQEEEMWKAMRYRGKRSRGASAKSNYYVKIDEDEIASDYPLPAFYKSVVEEADEYLFFPENEDMYDTQMLPMRILHNWCLYNSDSRLVPLEILPLQPGAEPDITVYGSGYMLDDDGSGFLEYEGEDSSINATPQGIPVYLTAIREWMIEFGGSMISITIRTDGAWYRLGKPSKQYALWYQPVLKTATVAVCIIKMLKEESRVSRLSVNDVIKKMSQLPKEDPAYISNNLAGVERYIVVHGQIIIRQFSEFPDEMIRKSAFISGLKVKMEERHHTKLLVKKKLLPKREENHNPVARMRLESNKRKAMQATTTKLINRIWGEYYSNYSPEEGVENAAKEAEKAEEDVQDENEKEDEDDDDEEEEKTLSGMSPAGQRSPVGKVVKGTQSVVPRISWKGSPVTQLKNSELVYRNANVGGNTVNVGGAIMVDTDGGCPAILYVEYMIEKPDGLKMVHGRIMLKASETVLGNAGNSQEVFLTNDCLDVELGDVKESVILNVKRSPWGHQYRKDNAEADRLDRLKAEERAKAGLPIEYYCKSLYSPEQGGFFTLPYNSMGLGNGCCYSCNSREARVEKFRILSGNTGFIYKGVQYKLNDFLYVNPEQFPAISEAPEEEKFKAGRNVGLRAFVVCQLLGVEVSGGSKLAEVKSTSIKVRRFYRPEDRGSEKAYLTDVREVYCSETICTVPVDSVEGKCEVRRCHALPALDGTSIFDHTFFCQHIFDSRNGSLKQIPSTMKFDSPKTKTKDKGKAVEIDESYAEEGKLATLDIFSGCGGLSAGLHQSGVSITKWAIEYDEAAAGAFKLNHQNALVFNENCNVILRAIMEKCGDKDDCISTNEAVELASKLTEENRNALPLPGEVDFINGGPPCQGFSGMNRFNQSIWSKVQCEMILAFLSFADYFRPRFFLLENVRNFVSFNKGQTFRLTVASLLEMGYQVRFGVLEAGHYGVPQARKRAIIWAASPDETLPEWPEPMHVFSSAQLKISLSKDSYYAAVRSTAQGAPFRSVTVRDTIGDLPPVQNGEATTEIMYTRPPESWFQKQIRSNADVLADHISKEMNELNLIRCKSIPKRAGADWRDLPERKVKLSSGQMADLIPWCLPNTAKRHNQWKGLYGRLNWEGNFPTSITDPQPMGKVGMCFHPEQDRIITVRECARSQGFLDTYKFFGSIQNKHRQIGNAVPPPMALALGRKLKEALDKKQ